MNPQDANGSSQGLRGMFASRATEDDPYDIYRNNGKIKSAKASKLFLAQDMKRLQEDPNSFGLSDAEKEKMKAEASQVAGAQNQAQASNLAQTALAGQGFQQGSFADAQRGVADATADAGVKASIGINDLSSRMIEGEKARIMGDLDAARERTRDDARFWSQFGIDNATKLVGAGAGAYESGFAGAGVADPGTAEGIDAAAGGYGAMA